MESKMKQAYMAPEMEVIEMNMETLLMALSAAGSLDGTQIGGPASGKDADANGRRGSWGNLWEDNKRW